MRPSAYSTWLFLNTASAFANTVVFTVAAVYFVSDVGANPFELVFIGTVMEITIFVFEVPTGAFADNHGRRLSVVVAYVIQGAGLVLAGSTADYAVVLAGYVVWGIGATFESGALEAWIADEIEGRDLERVFLRGERAAFAGALLGLGPSVALASADLAWPFIVAGALNIVLGGVLAMIMREDHFEPARDSDSESRSSSMRKLWATAASGFRIVRSSRWLIVVLVIVALFGMHSEGLDRLWEAHFLVNFSFPSLGELEPVVWFGIIGGLQLVLGIFISGLASRRGAGRSLDPAGVLISLVSIQLVGAVAFGLAGNFLAALIAYLVTGLARAVGVPIFHAWINTEIDSSQRATVLSIVNQSDAVGQWLGGPAIGAVGAVVSLRAALSLAAVVLFPIVPLFVRLRRHGREGGSREASSLSFR